MAAKHTAIQLTNNTLCLSLYQYHSTPPHRQNNVLFFICHNALIANSHIGLAFRDNSKLNKYLPVQAGLNRQVEHLPTCDCQMTVLKS